MRNLKGKYIALYHEEVKFRTQLMNDLKHYSDEFVHKKPSLETWSIADNIAHLIARDEYEYNYISKKIKEGKPLEDTGAKARLRRFILRVAFALPIKFKVPKQVAPSEEYLTFKELESKWNMISKAKHELLSGLTDAQFRKDIMKHPRVGMINIVQMTDFGLEHGKRHEKQIKQTIDILNKNR